MSKRFLLPLTLSGLLLAGCSLSISDLSGKGIDVEEIDNNLFRSTAYWAHEKQQVRLREFLYERATEHCAKMKKGAQLLDAVSTNPPKGGSKATLVYRCVQILKAPDSDLFGGRDK